VIIGEVAASMRPAERFARVAVRSLARSPGVTVLLTETEFRTTSAT
jgi:hypothetical protein